jgi:hypothetical protein
MYRSGRKSGFAGCQKVVPIPNSADPLCKTKNVQSTVARARLRQKHFLNHIIVFKLQGAIENIDAQVYPNGSTLEEQICGFHDPITLQRIFIGIDKTGMDEYTLTHHECNSRVAQETAHHLGIIMHQKFGVQGTVGFSPTYIQLRANGSFHTQSHHQPLGIGRRLPPSREHKTDGGSGLLGGFLRHSKPGGR